MGKAIAGLSLLLVAWSSGAANGQCPSGVDSAATRERVQAALHSDPYFFDRHVTVAVENDRIVLRGFVFSDWDLRDALRISRGAACNWPVVDELSIMIGGRR